MCIMLCYNIYKLNPLKDQRMASSTANRKAADAAAFPKPGHNHSHCAKEALHKAEAICTARKTRLTDIRRRVLEAVWKSHVPVGAYDILARFNVGGGRVAPMAVYRALEFLMENGLVHRIASLNAYIGCAHMGSEHHAAQFLICRSCGTTAELESASLEKALTQAVAARGFTIDSQIVEISGVCPHCKNAS
jgi:Fur family transcriptional regulator, zinc uptake regulator